jgi:hypothetical protein
MWCDLTAAYVDIPTDLRNPTLMGGFLAEAHLQDANFAALALDAAIDEPSLASSLPYLQARVGIDAMGIARLRAAIAKGALVSKDFWSIANRSIEGMTATGLRDLLCDVANLAGGVAVAIKMLHMYIFCRQDSPTPLGPELIDVGRNLLLRLDFGRDALHNDRDLRLVVPICLSGTGGEHTASKICWKIKSSRCVWDGRNHDISHLLNGVFEAQPVVALNELFLLPIVRSDVNSIFRRYGNGMPVERVAPSVLTGWADKDPSIRYKLLGRAISIFTTGHGGEKPELSPLFLKLLEHAPDKSDFLGDYYRRLKPNVWGGSLADVLVQRLEVIRQLGDHRDCSVRQWLTNIEAQVADWIESEQQRDRRVEESFE